MYLPLHILQIHIQMLYSTLYDEMDQIHTIVQAHINKKSSFPEMTDNTQSADMVQTLRYNL